LSICFSHCLEEEDEKNEATQFCLDRQITLCSDHAAIHQKVKKTKEHVLVPVDQMPKESIQVSIKKPCPKHKVEKMKFLCQCDELICLHYAVTVHKQDDFKNIDEATNEERANLKQLIMPTQKDVNPVEKSLSEVVEMMKKIKRKCENECKKVQEEVKN
jgi:hypothetical protein